MPNINIDDAYILGETGAQVDKVTGLFTKDEGTTSGEKAFAQLNIGTAGSNRNLLDNPWFTVDQTSVTTGSNPAATAVDVRDRWRVAYCTSYTFNNDGTITTVWNGSGAGAYLIQYALLDEAALWAGKEVTFSGYVDGVLVSKTFTLPTSGGVVYTLADGVYLRCNNTTANNRGFEFQVYHTGTSGKTLGPFKLEKGNISTLPNDGPPDYQKELAKCQRVFIRIKSSSAAVPVAFGVQYTSTAIRCTVPTPVEMRNQPTVSFSGTHNVYGGGTASKAVSSYTPIDRNSLGVCLIANISSGTFASSENYIVYIASGGYLDLSCRPS